MRNSQENKKRMTTAVIWSCALVLVLAVGIMTFFSAASQKTKNPTETPKNEKAEVQTDNEKTNERKKNAETSISASAGNKNKQPAETQAVTEPMTEDVLENLPSEEPVDEMEVPAASYPSEENFTCVMPVNGTVSKEFTEDIAVYSLTMNDYRVHNGIDIYAPVGTNVMACAAGTVERVWDDPFLGSCVEINHGGDLHSVYCNLSPEHPKGMEAGATVVAGDVIGGVGETMVIEAADSDHLHFCMLKGGIYVDPMNYISNYRGESPDYDE